MLDKENLKKNSSYAKLPQMTIIVVSPKDMEGKGEALTYVGRVYMESATEVGKKPRRFKDKELFIFVNASYDKTDTPVGKIIHDLTATNDRPKLTDEFAAAVARYESVEEGRKEMLGKIADFSIEAKDWDNLLSDADREKAEARGRKKGRKEGRKEGRARGEKNLAQVLLAQGALSKAALEAAFRQMGRPMPI